MNVKKKIIEKINEKTFIQVDEFINSCLHEKNAYYLEKKPIGKNYDFITAPEISQMFGEIIGIYILNYWLTYINSAFNLIELGPGKCTLLKDIIRVSKINKSFIKQAKIHLIEQNNQLIKFQKDVIKSLEQTNIKWSNDFDLNSSLPSIIYSNEFFDCLAIRQFYKKKNWLEKYIGYNKKNDQFYFFDKEISDKILIKRLEKFNKSGLAEISAIRELIFDKICKQIKKNNGLIITIDYGYKNFLNNFSLQSIYKHKKTHLFEHIGYQDITSFVNFKELIDIAKNNDLNIDKFCTQKEFLLTHGLKERKEILKKNLSFNKQQSLEIEFDRLINNSQMGADFKVLIVSN